MLVCTQCDAQLAPFNPARTGKGHFGANGQCKKTARAAANVAKRRKSNGSSPAAGRSSFSQADSSSQLLAKPAQSRAEVKLLTKFICTCSTPAAIENEHLRAAFAGLGVNLPGGWC